MPRRRATRPSRPPLRAATERVVDKRDGQWNVRPITGATSTKTYTCPGCHSPIAPATGHLVVVPLVDPEDRRHWHRSCWARRHRRRPR